MMKYFIIAFLFLPVISQAQSTSDRCDFNFSILQKVLPGDNWNIRYQISEKGIQIYKIKATHIGNNEILRKRRLYNKRLYSTDIDSIRIIIDNIDILNLSGNYSSGQLDGIVWTFDFDVDCYQKQIILDNYYLLEFGLILDYIDKKVPLKKRYISFDYFDIRENFENNL